MFTLEYKSMFMRAIDSNIKNLSKLFTLFMFRFNIKKNEAVKIVLNLNKFYKLNLHLCIKKRN